MRGRKHDRVVKIGEAVLASKTVSKHDDCVEKL